MKVQLINIVFHDTQPLLFSSYISSGGIDMLRRGIVA